MQWMKQSASFCQKGLTLCLKYTWDNLLKRIYNLPLINLDLDTILVEHLLKTKKKENFLTKRRFKVYLSKRPDKSMTWHDMVNSDVKDLPRRTASDKGVHGKAFNIANNPKYAGYKRGLASMF